MPHDILCLFFALTSTLCVCLPFPVSFPLPLPFNVPVHFLLVVVVASFCTNCCFYFWLCTFSSGNIFIYLSSSSSPARCEDEYPSDWCWSILICKLLFYIDAYECKCRLRWTLGILIYMYHSKTSRYIAQIFNRVFRCRPACAVPFLLVSYANKASTLPSMHVCCVAAWPAVCQWLVDFTTFPIELRDEMKGEEGRRRRTVCAGNAKF